MKIKASLDNITYDLLYTPKNNCKFYKPLLTALWSKLTENQKHKVIIINPNNPEQKIINFDDIVYCFKQSNEHSIKCNNGQTTFKSEFLLDRSPK